jgi:hypothetical protein
MTREERITSIKLLLWMASPLPAIGLTGTFVNVYGGEWKFLLSIGGLGISLAFSFGVWVLLNPNRMANEARFVLLGALAAILLAMLAPESIRIGVVNLSLSPRWLVASALSAIASLTYVWFAFRYWKYRKVL